MKDGKMILSFDLEFWYDTAFLEKYLPEVKPDRLAESVLPILELLEKYHASATFFTTGQILEKYPELIRKIHSQGHEIASHGYSHQLLGELGEETFKKDMARCVELQEKIIGKRPLGFRAPCFSLNERTKWALSVLSELGFKYHSEREAIVGSSLKEILVGRVGGVYFRLLPLCFFKKMLRKTRIVYLHPHELDRDTPLIKDAPYFKRFLKYYGVKNSLQKFEKLLQSFEFGSVQQILGL